MDHLEAIQEYARAQRIAQKEHKELTQQGKPASPAVLDELLGNTNTEQVVDVGLVEIPAQRIIGTKTAVGRRYRICL